MPNFPQHFDAISFRHIQIEQYEAWARHVWPAAYLLKILYGFMPVSDDIKPEIDARLAKCFGYDVDIRRVIFDQ